MFLSPSLILFQKNNNKNLRKSKVKRFFIQKYSPLALVSSRFKLFLQFSIIFFNKYAVNC